MDNKFELSKTAQEILQGLSIKEARELVGVIDHFSKAGHTISELKIDGIVVSVVDIKKFEEAHDLFEEEE